MGARAVTIFSPDVNRFLFVLFRRLPLGSNDEGRLIFFPEYMMMMIMLLLFVICVCVIGRYNMYIYYERYVRAVDDDLYGLCLNALDFIWSRCHVEWTTAK